MRLNGQLNPAQVKALREQLKQLALPPAKQQRLLWRMAKYGAITAAKRHVREQATPDGQAWDKRKTKRKGKMLRNMPKHLKIRSMPNISAVRVYLQGGDYRSGQKPIRVGVVGQAQQSGMNVTVNRRQVTSSTQAAADKGQPCSLRQAKRLRKLDYKVRKGKRWRKPGYKEIQQSLSKAQAGLIIRKLAAADGKPVKSSWSVRVPPRPFLGMSDEEFDNAMARQLQGINHGWNVKAQDIKGHV